MGDEETHAGDVAINDAQPSEPSVKKVVALAGTIAGESRLAGALSLSTTLVANHIQAAALFARQAAALEAAHDEQASEEVRADHRAYVIGSVFAAVAFLEAAINQVFEYNPAQWPAVPHDWEQKAKDAYKGSATLAKFRLALALTGKSQQLCPSVDAAYSDASDLIVLRNRLTHYEPTLHTVVMSEPVPEEKAPKLERLLRRRVVTHNPLYPAHSHFLHEYLSHDCARWAVQAALTFADAFYVCMGLQPPYDSVRQRLNTQ